MFLVALAGCVIQTRYVHLTGNIMVDGPGLPSCHD